jgi:hypothetical protein
MTAEQIAQVCHEANTAYCLVVGDDALPHWSELDETYRQSSINGVALVLAGATPESLHAGWMKERLASGWTYGPKLDREAKVHTGLVPYAELPAAQKLKDALFASIVHTLKESAE